MPKDFSIKLDGLGDLALYVRDKAVYTFLYATVHYEAEGVVIHDEKEIDRIIEQFQKAKTELIKQKNDN